MQILEINLSRASAQFHWAAVLNPGLGVDTPVGLAGTGPERIPTAVKPVSRAETGADWLDTPAAHCSPLDDY